MMSENSRGTTYRTSEKVEPLRIQAQGVFWGSNTNFVAADEINRKTNFSCVLEFSLVAIRWSISCKQHGLSVGCL